MHKAIILLGSFLITIGLAACASNGNESLRDESESSVQNKMVEGRTTKAEVRAMYGDPLKTTSHDGGMESWTYEFKDLSADGTSYVPFANWFTATSSGTKKELVVLFDAQDIVKRYSMSESEVTEKTGAFNRE